MKESHRKDLASHPDPESCVGVGNATGEALTGAHAGQPSSCEIPQSGVPTLFSEAEGNTGASARASSVRDPRSRRPCACVETLCTGTGRSCQRPPAMVRRVGRRRPLAVRPTCTRAGSRTIA